MGRVYAVASAKGGVGKTTTTANLGVTLAAAGHRVAVVDADMGMPNLGRLLAIDVDGPTLHDVLAGDADPLDAVYEGPNGLSVVPGDPSLDAYAKATPKRLGGVIAALSDYDIVLIDTGAGLSHDTVLPLGFADAVLLVSTPSPDALGDTEKTRQLAERVGASVLGLVLTRVDTERVDAEDVASLVNARLVEVVPEDTESGDEGGDQLAVRRDDDSPVTAAYRALGDALAADAMAAEFEADAAAAADAAPDAADDAVDEDTEAAGGEGTDEATDEGDEDEGADEAAADTTESDPSPADIDVSSVLDDSDDGLDTVLSVGDELAEVDDETGDEGEEAAGDDDEVGDDEAEGDDEAGDDEATDDDNEDDDVVFEAEETADGADEDGDASETDDETVSADSGGLASTLEAVEADEDDDADADGENDDVDVSDVVKEAEPDADDQGVQFDSAPESEDEGVTIEPEESLDVPDAEANDADDADGDDADDGEETVEDEANGDAADEADEEDEDERETDGEKKGGLFGRFFG